MGQTLTDDEVAKAVKSIENYCFMLEACLTNVSAQVINLPPNFRAVVSRNIAVTYKSIERLRRDLPFSFALVKEDE